MHSEDDLLPLSGLQHMVFCERQWALIHLEQTWVENRLTALGRVEHERVDETGPVSRPDGKAVAGLRLRSLRLGIAGRADVVEFHPAPSDQVGFPLEERSGPWLAFPVEHKHGKPKPDDCDLVQLCAQAICLEEMLGSPVPGGAIFYGRTRRRLAVEFDSGLRERTTALAERMHALFRAGTTPPARYAPKCDSCSLFSVCLPRTVARRKNAVAYCNRIKESILNGEED